ncbi:hypothetical protein [Paracoccus sp. (in: a-proteobacteria)]|uniref:hypothetical protein n=1 Tax=Paracoccus sp. TaxID=267 RepID=UPI0034CFAC42
MWKLALLLYPFTAAAVAINLFLFSLMGRAIGWASLSPGQALFWAVILGVPATVAAGKWARRLMDQADAS